MDSKDREHDLKAADRLLRRGRIGLIVAGSLITGFVAALVLVIGPSGRAQEHVIMGTALLGWAFGCSQQEPPRRRIGSLINRSGGSNESPARHQAAHRGDLSRTMNWTMVTDFLLEADTIRG